MLLKQPTSPRDDGGDGDGRDKEWYLKRGGEVRAGERLEEDVEWRGGGIFVKERDEMRI